LARVNHLHDQKVVDCFTALQHSLPKVTETEVSSIYKCQKREKNEIEREREREGDRERERERERE
jgi:hypothetical protein